jgi:nucleoside-diphosphate-sugar epimerase
MLNRQQPVINGNGSQTRDFVYVDYVVSANMFALKGGLGAGIFIIEPVLIQR